MAEECAFVLSWISLSMAGGGAEVGDRDKQVY